MQVKGGVHHVSNDLQITKSRGSKNVIIIFTKDIDKLKTNGITDVAENNNKINKSRQISNGGIQESSKQIKKIYSLGVIEEIKEKTIEDNVIIYSDGTKYQGAMKLNKRYGKGILFNDFHTIYDGEWFNDVFHGQGILYQENGMIYNGNFVNGKREGKGIQFSDETGESYTGEWRDDEKSGSGTI